jgi:hypothetical protein
VLRFAIPDITVDLGQREDTLLTLELEALRFTNDSPALYHAALALERIDQARRQRAIVDLRDAHDQEIVYAIARAVAHIRAHAPEGIVGNENAEPMPHELDRLGNAARAWAGLDGAFDAYELVEDGWKDLGKWASRVGPYSVNDRLVLREGRAMSVDAVDQLEDGAVRLRVTEPPAPQLPTFELEVHGQPRVISISDDAGRAIVRALRGRGRWVLGANITLATQLGSGTRVHVTARDDVVLLEVIDELDAGAPEGTYDFGRLRRALHDRREAT